jgi:hypothetical protein
MATKYVILATEDNDDGSEHVSVVDDIREAEVIVASHLENGFTRESIRLLAGTDVPFMVTHKPIVSALEDHPESETAAEAEDAAPALVNDSTLEEAGDGYVRPRGVWEPAGASAEEAPYTKDGMRFSKAFARP